MPVLPVVELCMLCSFVVVVVACSVVAVECIVVAFAVAVVDCIVPAFVVVVAEQVGFASVAAVAERIVEAFRLVGDSVGSVVVAEMVGNCCSVFVGLVDNLFLSPRIPYFRLLFLRSRCIPCLFLSLLPDP